MYAPRVNKSTSAADFKDTVHKINQSPQFSRTISESKQFTDLIDKNKFSNDPMVFISINKFVKKVRLTPM